MLLDAHLEGATPAEVVALARLAQSPDLIPPPHLRPELQAKGWVDETDDGEVLLTGEGRMLVEKFQ
jgi:hypothetical protein